MGWLEDLQKKQQGETDSAPKTHYCWHCAKEIAANNFHRQDTCENCGRSTHACKNCEFYDTTFNNLCRESSADRVVDKETSNFCDFFKPSTRGPGAGSKSANDLKSAADALFKKK
jgi:hypothetical protein